MRPRGRRDSRRGRRWRASCSATAFVGSVGCRRPMPRPPVASAPAPALESLGECGVGGPALGGGGCLVDRRADQWVTHPDEVAVDPQQARALHLTERVPRRHPAPGRRDAARRGGASRPPPPAASASAQAPRLNGASEILVGTELKISECRLAKCTSSNDVSAQCPGPASNPSRTGASKNLMGASRRSVAKAPSRRSSSRDQNSSEPRSMSADGTSGGGVPFSRRSMPGPIVVVMLAFPADTDCDTRHPEGPASHLKHDRPADGRCRRVATLVSLRRVYTHGKSRDSSGNFCHPRRVTPKVPYRRRVAILGAVVVVAAGTVATVVALNRSRVAFEEEHTRPLAVVTASR